MKSVNWIKNNNNNDWFDFLRLNLDAPYFMNQRGVYVIWYTTPSVAKVIRVGSGNIAERLKDHRSNPEITKFSSFGQLKVSWLTIDNINIFEGEIIGIEKYLARVYSPLVGDRYPDQDNEVSVTLIGQ